MNTWVQLGTRTPAILVVLACFELLNACATSTLFRAKFDADSVGAPPATNPPGPPSGDQIWIADPTDLTVVQSPELNSKAVSYRNLNLDSWQRFVGFFSQTSVIPANQGFRAIWAGRIYLPATGSGLEVWLGDGHFGGIAAFRFKGGNILLKTSSGSNPTYETIGSYYDSVTHTVIISVDKATAKYSLGIFQSQGPFVGSGWRPVLSTEAMNTSTPTLYFWYYEEGKSGAGNYVVDDISITKVQF